MSGLTFLSPLSSRCPARKTHRVTQSAAGYRLETVGYGKAAQFRFSVEPVSDVEDLFEVLERRQRQNSFAIRGQVHPGRDPNDIINRRTKGDDGSIIDAPSRLLPLDLDNEVAPDWLDTDDIKAVGEYLRTRLPPELSGVSCAIQLSAGFGLSHLNGKPRLLKSRLWFLNSIALNSAQLRALFRAWNATGHYAVVDEAIASCNQPIYTAAPLFEGLADPVPERLCLLLGEVDEARIEPPKIEARPMPADFAGQGVRCPERLAVCVAMIRAAKEGEKHTVLNRASYLAGGFVAGGACTIDEAREALQAAISAKAGVADLAAAFETIENSLRDGMCSPIGEAPEINQPVALAKQSDFEYDLKRLREAPRQQARATAKAILNRYSWRCPWKLSFTEMAERVCQALPADSPANLPDWVRRRACWLERKATETAKEQSEIADSALRRAGVEVVRVSSIEEAYDMIAADPTPIWLNKAPIGTGKTEKLLKPLALAATCSVGITHRVSLVEDLATRLQLVDYKKADKEALECCSHLGICLNSLCNPKFADILFRAKTVLVDEISAVCREAHNPSGTLGKATKATWERLVHLLSRAKVACGVDADLSTKDVLTLTKAVKRPVKVVIVDGEPKELTATVGGYRQVWQQALACAAAGIKFRVATDSAKQVRKLEAAIKQEYPHLRVMAIHSDPGTATSGDEAVKALLSDINTKISDVDVLIHSPCVESGVSLTVPHFKQTFGIYCGAVSPSAFIQMLRRDRTADHFAIGVLNNGIRFEETDPGTILANLEASHRMTTDIAACEGGYRMKLVPASTWDGDVAEYRAISNGATNTYAQNLCLLLAVRGCQVAQSNSPSVDTVVITAANAGAKTAYHHAINSAPDISTDERESLNQIYQPTPAQSAVMARYDLQSTLAIKELDDEAFTIWCEGSVRRRVERFEVLMSAPLQGLANDATDDAAAIPIASRSNRLAKSEAYRLVFEVLGVDLGTGKGEITAEGALEAFENLAASPLRPVLEAAGLCRFARTPKYPIRWASDILGKFGLRLTEGMRSRANDRLRIYGISDQIKLGLPGWKALLAIVSRRAVPDRPINTNKPASGTHTRAYQRAAA